MSGTQAAPGAPAAAWRCGATELDLGRTRVMGIVNVTPDSFSDGGDHDTAEAAVAWGMRLLDEGADLLDVGGESTRPGFTPVDPAVEAARVLPVVEALARAGALVSVDTRHAEVAEAALAAGARIVNDVTGFEDPAMVALAARTGCGCVVMHANAGHWAADPGQGAGAAADAYVGRVERYLLGRAAALEAAGVAPACICIDPGPGFGTSGGQDVAVQRAAGRLARLGYPLACAVSRKRFVGAVSGAHPAAARDAASAGVALAAALAGARVVRTHNVACTSEALRAAETCLPDGPAPRRAYVALGSNLGDRVQTLRAAARAVGDLPLTELAGASRVYETEPAYLDGQGAFANAVLAVETALHPLALLEALLAVEASFGRVRTVANGPRTLDLDLLWMWGEAHAGARLALPHPLMGERDFVLRPLGDLVGDAEAFCAEAGVRVVPAPGRFGRVVGELGALL